MACYAPVEGWRSQALTANLKRRIVFRRQEGFSDLHQVIPCGKCIGCHADRAAQWAARCLHEAALHADNCFLTLTYSEEHLPLTELGEPTLRPADFVGFMKRLRDHVSREWVAKQRGSKSGEVFVGPRFFQAGEYGQLGRPHHHVLLFSFSPTDLCGFRRSKDGRWLYRSPLIERLWPFGFSSVGLVEPGSAAYVAQYCLKKAVGVASTGSRSSNLGQPGGPIAEYQTMSRRPGLGRLWLDRFAGDVYPSDEVINREGKRMRVPRYYDELLKKANPRLLVDLKRARARSINPALQASSRMLARQENHLARVKAGRRGSIDAASGVQRS